MPVHMTMSGFAGVWILRGTGMHSIRRVTILIMDKATFMAKFGAVVEHSPWVAEEVFERAADDVLDDAESLSARFGFVFMNTAPEQQLATLRAHPQLACALATPQDLTSDSATEQAGAGLDQCSVEEMESFRKLNIAYREKFGFPFIIAVKGRDRQEILGLFEKRIDNDERLEYQTALVQVCRIVRFRIGEILNV